MTWWVSADRLSQPQLRIVVDAVHKVSNTPSGACIWVQGCAGTGKTLILAHVARRLQSSKKDCSLIFLTYTHALTAMINKTISQSGVGARASTHLSFLRAPRHYDVIFLDEMQDIKLADLTALKRRCTHLVVAGDCEQRIYEDANTESAIDKVVTFEKGRLKELFRITRFIVKVAQKLTPWTKLAEGDTSIIKRDVSIVVKQFYDRDREANWVYTQAMDFARPGSPSVILLPTHTNIMEYCHSLASSLGIVNSGPKIKDTNGRISDYNELNQYFKFHNVHVSYLGNGIGTIDDADGRPFVFIMTYHSAKGLDFLNVYMPFLHSRQFIAKEADAARTLFFVAITRTRERLVLSYTGDSPHAYIREMPKDVVVSVTDDPKMDKDVVEEFF